MSRERIEPGLFALPLAVGSLFAAVSAAAPVRDSDVFWQLAAGRDLLARGLVRGDTFSWTATGATLATDQWLGQILLYCAWLVGSWQGVIALRTLAVGVLVGLIVIATLDARRDRPLLAILASLPAVFLTSFVWSERPELLGFVCFALLVLLLRRGRAGSDRSLVLAVPLIALWANLHGSFALGVVLIGAVSLEGWWSDRSRRRVYVATACAALVASLATPMGIAAWTAPGFHFTQPPREIQEWMVVDPRTLPGAIYSVVLGAVVLFAFLGPRKQLAELALLLPVTFLSLTALRQTPYLAIAAAPFIARSIPWPNLVPSPRPGTAATIVASVLSAALIGGATLLAPSKPDVARFPPIEVLMALPGGPGTFNQYDWGGYLIWAAPQTPVFVDGRLTLYLGSVLDDYRMMLAAAPTWRDVVERRGIQTLLVRPNDPLAVRARDLGWAVLAQGVGYIVIRVP